MQAIIAGMNCQSAPPSCMIHFMVTSIRAPRHSHLDGRTTLDGRVRVTAVVTGASSGIGRATALRLAREGYHVVATSRDVNRSESVDEVVPQLLDDAGRVDALVNNAGYGLWGCLEDVSIDEVKAQFETNVFGVLRLTQAFLPHMRERTNGTIVNVGSVSGQIGSPAGGAYAASKFALRGLTTVMRMELAPFGLRVVLIEPGLFRTQFMQNRVIGRKALDPKSPYSLHTQRIARSSGSHQRWAGDPDRVARTIARIIKSRRPKARYTVGADAFLGSLAARLLPDSVLHYIVMRTINR